MTNIRAYLCFALGISSLLLTACQNYPFGYQQPQSIVVTHTKQAISGSGQNDILFVIDNSGSMADKQADLKQNASAFIKQITTSNIDYHIGIVTTDLFAATDAGRLRMAVNGPRFFSAPSPSDPNATAIQQQIIDGFTATVASLGTGGSSSEAGLGAARYALDATLNPAAAQLNAGFLRPDADLVIIILSDEDDCSFLPQYASTFSASLSEDATCYEQLQDLYSADSFVDYFTQLKGDVSKVHAAIITAGIRNADGSFTARACRVDNGAPSYACGCWLYSNDAFFCQQNSQLANQPCISVGTCGAQPTCPSQAGGACDTPRCSATASQRYTQFLHTLTSRRVAAGLTAGTYADTVCQTDYHDAMMSIANSVVSSSCITLGAPAVDANSIAVTLSRAGGAPQPIGRLDASDPSAACHSCGDCPNGAWQYVSQTQVCLTCGLTKENGDLYDVEAMSQATNN